MNSHVVVLSPKNVNYVCETFGSFDHSLEAVLTLFDLHVVVAQAFFFIPAKEHNTTHAAVCTLFVPYRTMKLVKLLFSKLVGWVKSKRPTIRGESLTPSHCCRKMYTDINMLPAQLGYTDASKKIHKQGQYSFVSHSYNPSYITTGIALYRVVCSFVSVCFMSLTAVRIFGLRTETCSD